MGTPRSPWMTKVYELLADREWHDRETVMAAAMPLVSPGKALRQVAYDRARLAAGRRRKGTPTLPANTRRHDDQTVGARSKVSHSLSTAITQGYLERRTVDGVPQIRLTPKPTTNEGTP